MIKIIPKLGDTKDVLQIKYTQLRDMLTEKYNGQILGLEAGGFDVSRFQEIQPSEIDITQPQEDYLDLDLDTQNNLRKTYNY